MLLSRTEKPSLRMQGVQAPIIPIVGQLVREHPGTISLGQGVVSYPPPPQVSAQLARFFADPENHKYKPVDGIAPLIEALRAKLATENHIQSAASTRLVVTAGGNMAFMNALLAIADPGDEIILPAPYYFNHEMAIAMASCKAVLAPTDSHYQLRPEAIRERITSRTRAVVTVSPNNPTGAVYSADALHEVNALCRSRGIYHISDEAYEYFTYGAPHVSPASFANSERHTISLFSFSKSYGFASWRIGYMLIPAHLEGAVKKIQDTILICPPVVSQFAALGALEAGAAFCRSQVRELSRVRELVLGELESIRDLCSASAADGAFYVFLNVQTRMDALQLVERLIKEHGVAVIPGTAFGTTDGCTLRVAYGALSKASVAAGIGRLVRGLKTLTR